MRKNIHSGRKSNKKKQNRSITIKSKQTKSMNNNKQKKTWWEKEKAWVITMGGKNVKYPYITFNNDQ